MGTDSILKSATKQKQKPKKQNRKTTKTNKTQPNKQKPIYPRIGKIQLHPDENKIHFVFPKQIKLIVSKNNPLETSGMYIFPILITVTFE